MISCAHDTGCSEWGKKLRLVIRKEFHGNFRYAGPKHVSDIRFDGTVHNNKMERMNGEIRDREKVMRSLKTPETPIILGMQIFHNYIRPHMALEGRTPAEAAGIDIKGKDRWLTIIQNASAKKEFEKDERGRTT
jgi:hypothetical protein